MSALNGRGAKVKLCTLVAPSEVLGATHPFPVISSMRMVVQKQPCRRIPEMQARRTNSSRQREWSAKIEGPGMEGDPIGQLDVGGSRRRLAAQHAEQSTMDKFGRQLEVELRA